MVKTGPQFTSATTLNPLEVVADTRLPAAAGGMMAAYMARQWAFTNHRHLFGVAVRGPDGRVRYVQADAHGRGLPGLDLPGAQLNRTIYNLATVGLGALLIGQSGNANLDYAGLGLAAGGLANTAMNLLNVQ